MVFAHRDLSVNQHLVDIVDNLVQDHLGNCAQLIVIGVEWSRSYQSLGSYWVQKIINPHVAPGLNDLQQIVAFLGCQTLDHPFDQNQ